MEATEAEADAHTEVAGEMESVKREIRALDKGQEIEDELSQLKTRMKGEAKTKTDASA